MKLTINTKKRHRYFFVFFTISAIARKEFLHIFASLLKKSTMIVPLCNGSTEDFGSFSQGSNPCGTTSIKPSNFWEAFFCL
jgi:hypothetical protein